MGTWDTQRYGAVLVLRRIYHMDGTLGLIGLRRKFICFTIELPWRRNKTNLSCIPQGMYELERVKVRGKDRLQLDGVPGRTGIQIHPANHALLELKGCIAPVERLTGPDSGIGSRKATQTLLDLDAELRAQYGSVWLLITGSPNKKLRYRAGGCYA